MAEGEGFFSQMRSLWTGMAVGQKIALVLTTLAVVVGFVLLTAWYEAADYKILYGGLSAEDASQIVESLQAENIPYKLTEGGKTVQVPSDRVYDLRLKLAGQGIPNGGEVGYEIFDKTSFGMTSFAQRLNFLRALEGELTRTIRRLSPVEGARVHLVIPEKRLFEEQSEPASASVVLKLRSEGRLSSKQVQSIVFLVASSVEGLKPEHVTVVDTQGNVLHQEMEGESAVALASNQLEYKTTYEREVERRVREMLDKMYGAGASVVRVAATFNFDKVDQTAERYDPEAVAVRSEERTSESSSGGAGGPSGVPGVASNVGPGAEQARAASATSSSSKESETINYEISKTITRTNKATGTLVKMSVAVAVDGVYKEAQPGAAKEYAPRSDEELAKIRSLVEKAAGVDAARGDQVEVTSIPFKTIETVEEPQAFLQSDLARQIIKYAALLIATLFFFLFLVRPLMKALAGGGGGGGAVVRPGRGGGLRPGAAGAGAEMAGSPSSLAQLERDMQVSAESADVVGEYRIEEKLPEEALKREGLKKRITEMVGKEPEEAANLVRTWLTEAD